MPACGAGNSRKFTCPYHAWVYDNKGRLKGVPGAAGFEAIDRDEYGLVELPNEERHGFIWAVLTAGAEIEGTLGKARHRRRALASGFAITHESGP